MLVPEGLDSRIRKAAARSRLSRGEWVRRAIERALESPTDVSGDPLARLAGLNGPTGDIDQMLAEIEAGRR